MSRPPADALQGRGREGTLPPEVILEPSWDSPPRLSFFQREEGFARQTGEDRWLLLGG